MRTRLSIDRRVLVGGALGVAAAAVVLGVVGLARDFSSLASGDRASCSSSNPDGSFSHGVCPPAVIPPHAGDSVPVTVEAAMLGGTMEGEIAFVEATSADDQLVWYQPLVLQSDWPPAAIVAAYLPPGSYDFSFYLRVCGGNCGSLSAPEAVCTIPLTLKGYAGVVIEWDLSRGDPCASERPATH